MVFWISYSRIERRENMGREEGGVFPAFTAAVALGLFSQIGRAHV